MVLPRRSAYPLMALTAVSLCGDALAAEWKSGVSGGRPYAEIASVQPGAALRIECGDKNALWLRYYPTRGWNGGAPAAVRAGAYKSPMEIDGGDGALLSNLANRDIGITPALVNAMKRSASLVVEGPAAARVPSGQRTFALGNAAAAIGGVEARCPRIK